MSKVDSGHWADALEKSVRQAGEHIEFLEKRLWECEAENKALREELEVFREANRDI